MTATIVHLNRARRGSVLPASCTVIRRLLIEIMTIRRYIQAGRRWKRPIPSMGLMSWDLSNKNNLRLIKYLSLVSRKRSTCPSITHTHDGLIIRLPPLRQTKRTTKNPTPEFPCHARRLTRPHWKIIKNRTISSHGRLNGQSKSSTNLSSFRRWMITI